MIEVGQRLPGSVFKTMIDGEITEVSTETLFAGKRAVLFGVPGAFTPGCSRTHLPGYVEGYDKITANGFEVIACVSVNDAWVMNAWGEAQNAIGKVTMLADGSADFARAIGLQLDLTHVGMGMRVKRFSMVLQDGVIESLNVDEGKIDTTAAFSTCGI